MTADSADLKLVLLGEKNVGKTTLFNQYLYGEVLKTQMTIGAYFSKKEFTVGDKKYQVNVWDTAGEEKFHSLTKFYTRGAKAAIVVYDITVHDSWKAVDNWCKDLDEDCVLMIAGNKLDLVSSKKKQREISFEEVEKYARMRRALAIEGSAVTGHNVSNMFQKVVEEYITRNGHINGHRNSKVIDLQNKKSKKGCCITI